MISFAGLDGKLVEHKVQSLSPRGTNGKQAELFDLNSNVQKQFLEKITTISIENSTKLGTNNKNNVHLH